MVLEDHILVTGPMSSGTRVLCDVLTAGGLKPHHDKSHGTQRQIGMSRVIVIVRSPGPTTASVLREYHQVPIARALSIMLCAHQYPDALWVTYEQLCASPIGTVAIIAEWLGVQPWKLDFELMNQNAKSLNGSGPQIPTRQT